MGYSVEGDALYAYNKDGAMVGKDLDLRLKKFRTDEPGYVKAYLEDLSNILKVHRGDIRVLIELMKYMTYDNNIDINPRIKELVIKGMGYGTLQTVSNSVSRLSRAYLLIYVRRGCYIVDPMLFGRGSWVDIMKIKMQIVYTRDGGKVVKAEFIKEKKEPSKEIPIQEDNL
jgi:hypothetical protein